MSQNRISSYGVGGPQNSLAPIPFKSNRQFTGNILNYAYNVGQIVFQESTQQWIIYRGSGIWDVFAGGSQGDLLTLTGDDGIIVNPTSAGTIDVFGSAVPTGTNAKALYFKNTAANTLTAQIQVASATASTNIANAGLVVPNSAQMTTDANGFTTVFGNVQSSSGALVDLTISNTSNTAASDSSLIIETAGTSSGDPYLQLNVAGGAHSYALGIANTGGSNALKLQVGSSPVTPETGTNAWSVNETTGVMTFGPNPICDLITINNLPVIGTDGCNKTYVDSVAAGFTVLTPAVAATTANLTATYNNGTAGVGATLTNSGTQAAFTVDGYSANLNDRILVKNQTTDPDNGIYEVTTVGDGSSNWVLTRTTDYDTTAQIKPGTFIIVQQGSTQANTAWVQYETVTTIGTDPINWAEFGLSITFPITIAQGGTNATSMANINGINYFDGTRIVTAPALTNGELLIGNTSNPPTATTLTAGTGITIANSAGSITISESNIPAANSIVEIADDFLQWDNFSDSSGVVDITSILEWSGTANIAQPAAPIAGHPGIISFSGNAQGMFGNVGDHSQDSFLLGGGQITITWVCKLNSLTAPIAIDVGARGQAAGGYDIIFLFTGTGNWQIECSNADVKTVVDSGITPDVNWHNYTIIVNADASEVHFYIDGAETSNSPITTNIPTAGLVPEIFSSGVGQVTNNLNVDLYAFQQILTTPR